MSRCRLFWHRSKPERVNTSGGCSDNRLFPALVLLFAAAVPPTPVDAAFQRLYNFDFPAAHALLNAHLKLQPSDSVAYAVRASALLFRRTAPAPHPRKRVLRRRQAHHRKEETASPAPEARDRISTQALHSAEREAQSITYS